MSDSPTLPLDIEARSLPAETCETCGTAIVEMPTIAPNYKLWIEAESTRGNDTFYRHKVHKVHKCKKAPEQSEKREAAFREKASAYLKGKP